MTKATKFKNLRDLAVSLGLHGSRGLEAEIKATLTEPLILEIERRGLTNNQVAELADVSRGSVTGIINGSLQKVTVDRLLRIIRAIGLGVKVHVKKAG